MSRSTVWIGGALAVVLAAVLLVPVFSPGVSHSNGPEGLGGSTAPVFALRDDAGRSVSLRRLHGKIVVMNLWASWCPPCRAEMPDLQRLSESYDGRGVVVVGVNQGESAERARAFAASLHIAFPIWLDDQQRYGRAYSVLGLPTTVIIQRDGTIARGFDGALTYAQMTGALVPLLR